jgi:hypothetical protein
VLRLEAGRWWWAPLVAGVIWFVIAWLVLRMNVTSLAAVGVVIGIALVITAVNEAALAALMAGGWKVAHLVHPRRRSTRGDGRSSRRRSTAAWDAGQPGCGRNRRVGRTPVDSPPEAPGVVGRK